MEDELAAAYVDGSPKSPRANQIDDDARQEMNKYTSPQVTGADGAGRTTTDSTTDSATILLRFYYSMGYYRSMVV